MIFCILAKQKRMCDKYSDGILVIEKTWEPLNLLSFHKEVIKVAGSNLLCPRTQSHLGFGEFLHYFASFLSFTFKLPGSANTFELMI